MNIQIEQKTGSSILEVSYKVLSGKKQSGGVIGTIYPVDNKFVFMRDGLPINVVNNLHEMDNVIIKLFKTKPVYVNTLF
jgi:adenosine/AMP kinase